MIYVEAGEQSIAWNIYQGSGLVRIKNREIFLNAQGSPRKSGQPVIIFEAGLGDASYVWAAVQALTAEFGRTYAYDRAGMGQSQPGPSPRSAEIIARDLSDILSEADIDGPYIIVCHSYGGILAREFLHIRDADVCAIVFVDTITERYSKEGAVPEDDYDSVLGEINIWEANGMNKEHQLTPSDWELVIKTWPNDKQTTMQEAASFLASEIKLEAKDQFSRKAMGDRPVVVIKGNATREFKRVLEAGEAIGNGTKAQRDTIRELIKTSETFREKHQREQLQLSNDSRYIPTEHSCHMVQLTEPRVIVQEIRRVFEAVTRWREIICRRRD